MNAKPTVTVLLAVYNGEEHLAPAIESVLDQTYRDFELLIVDDGSDDGTRAIIADHASRDARVIPVHLGRNGGLPAALNIGLGRARGRYVARQDADDISEPDRLMDQVRHMDRHPECVVLGTWFRQVDPDDVVFDEKRPPNDSAWIVSELASGRNPIAHGSVMMRRDATTIIAGYDERFRYSQDYDLWLRCARRYPDGFGVLQSFGYRRRKLPMHVFFKTLCQRRFGQLALEQYRKERRIDFPDVAEEVRTHYPRSLQQDPAVSGQYWLQLSRLAHSSRRTVQARRYGLEAIRSPSASVRAKAALQLALTYLPSPVRSEHAR